MRRYGGWAATSVIAAGLAAAVGLAPDAGARASATSTSPRTSRDAAPPREPRFFLVQGDSAGEASGAPLRARTATVTVCLDGDGLAFAANGDGGADSVVRMSFEGLGPLRWQAEDRLAATASSFHGADASAWRRDIPLHRSAVARDEVRGVEIRLAGEDGLPAYALRVPPEEPGSAPRDSFGLRFDGASRTEVDADGRLVVSVSGGHWTHSAPRAWQESARGRRPVACRFVAGDGATARLVCGPCDPAATLVIDPAVDFARTFGQPNRWETSGKVSVDGHGRLAYVFVASDPIPKPYYGWPITTDLVVLRFDASGRKLLWSASLGAANHPGALVARDSGAVLLAGTTESGGNFPHVHSAFPTAGGNFDAFVAQFAPDGRSFEFATAYGGTGSHKLGDYDPTVLYGDDFATGACIDSEGGIVVVGRSESYGAPLVGRFARDTAGWFEGFVLRLSPDGRTAVHAGYFGGSGTDSVLGVSAGPDGSVFIVGETDSANLPVRDPVAGLSGTGREGFVARILPTGEMAWGSAIGGSSHDGAKVVVASTDGSVYVGGWTYSADFPVSGPGPFGPGGNGDVFVTHIDPVARTILESVRIGGARSDDFHAAARDVSGRLWLTGFTTSSDFPLLDELQSSPGAAANQSFVPFLVVLAADCDLLSSGYLGGSGYGEGDSISAGGPGLAWLAGRTLATDFPSVAAGEGPEAGNAYLMSATFGPSRPRAVTARVISGASVEVTWSHDGGDVRRFEVQSAVVGLGAFATAGFPAAGDRKFSGGNDHPLEQVAYRVRAWSADAVSGWSDESVVTLPEWSPVQPTAPTGLTLEETADGRLRLTWTDTSADETRFEVSRNPAGDGVSAIVPLAAGTTSWEDARPLPDRGVAEYRVRAANAAGASAWSATVTSTTPPTLAVDVVEGRIRRGKGARKSRVDLEGTVRRIDGAAFDPASAGLVVRLGGWEAGAEILHVDAGATGWRERRGTWTWSSPRRSKARVRVGFTPKSGRLAVSVSGFLPPEFQPGAITTSVGNSSDGGSDVSEWRLRRGSLRLR